MNNQPLPAQYRVEIYENSFVNVPAAAFDVSARLPDIQVGDHLDHRLWQAAGAPKPALDKNKTFRVKAVNHFAKEIPGSHVVHNLSFCVEVIPKSK